MTSMMLYLTLNSSCLDRYSWQKIEYMQMICPCQNVINLPGTCAMFFSSTKLKNVCFHWFSNWKTPNASVLSVTFYLWHEKCNAGLSTDRNVDFDLVTKNEFYELDLVEMKCWCTAWVSNKTKVVHDIFWIYFHPQSFITAEIWAHFTLLIIKLKLNAFVCVGLILQARMFRFWLKKLLLTLGLFVTWGLLR